MSLKDCIRHAVRQGRITLEEGEALEKRYDNIARRVLSSEKAKKQFADEVAAEIAERERRAFLTESARKARMQDLADHRDAAGLIDPRTFAWMHENQGQARVHDAEHRRLAIIGSAHAELDELLQEFRRGAVTGDLRRTSKLVGSAKTQARMDNVVRELFGEKTKDANAKVLADAFGKVAEDLRVRSNEAGSSIGKLEKWGLPQYHDPLALQNVGREAWVDYMMRDGVLDREKMHHQLTERPLSDEELREAMEVSYERIVSDGWFDREPSGASMGRGALFTQHADHRFIHFKNADAWLQYAKDFGHPDAYAAMMGHVSIMARDIAHMETFGPNPTVVRNYLKQVLQKEAMSGRADLDTTRQALNLADRMWDIQRGSLSAPVNGMVATTLQAARNLVTASALGGAQLSALSDVAFGSVRRGFVGMARAKSSTFRALVETLRHIGPENRREAVRSGLILDSALHVMHAQSRYAGTLDTRSITGFLADRVIALQGLSAWTQGGKHAFAMDMMGLFADHADKGWADLPDLVRSTLDRNGFDAARWDAIRKATPYQPAPGATFLRAKEIADAVGRELGERYQAMVLRETRYAVPEATVRSQAVLRGDTRPGTLAGELSRNFAQFKGFGVSVVMLHLGAIAREIGAGRGTRAASYAGALLLTSTVLGAMAMALKDIAAGRDPRRWTDEETYLDPDVWGAALLQAGGLGIYGDFLFANTNRFGGGLASTVAGPLVERVNTLRNFTVGNAQQIIQGKPTKFGAEGVKILRQNTPGGSLWYLKIAYERMLLDQLQMMVDPDARAAFHRQMQNRKRDYGQEFWWAPGETAPRRAPNMGATVGQ